VGGETSGANSPYAVFFWLSKIALYSVEERNWIPEGGYFCWSFITGSLKYYYHLMTTDVNVMITILKRAPEEDPVQGPNMCK
jgi:hypothetical protein